MDRSVNRRRLAAVIVASLPMWFLAADGVGSARSSRGHRDDTAVTTQYGAQLARDSVVIITQSGANLRFRVEIAKTPEQQARGLMFRYYLPRDEGMLFPFPQPRLASFWMKNTFIPLDIIFLSRKGLIVDIHPEATPGSTAPINSSVAVSAALELVGGTAAYFGLRRGDRVEHPFFD